MAILERRLVYCIFLFVTIVLSNTTVRRSEVLVVLKATAVEAKAPSAMTEVFLICMLEYCSLTFLCLRLWHACRLVRTEKKMTNEMPMQCIYRYVLLVLVQYVRVRID